MKLVIDGEVVEVSGGGGGGVPTGVIVIWSGTASDIPSGWALCDGQNGTPDLRDRFVLGGGGTHPVGETGGSETVTLTEQQMPAHVHSAINNGSSSTIKFNQTAGSSASFIKSLSSASTTSAGSGQPHNNMPPYYVLCYIIKL